MRLILKANPESVLDVGYGFGMWGSLIRQYVDVRRHFVWKGMSHDTWKTRVDGVDPFEKYAAAPNVRYFYDHVFAESAVSFFENLGQGDRLESYDLVILSHVLEHMPKADGVFVLESAISLCGSVIVGLPLDCEDEGHIESFGNPGELHHSDWASDIESLKDRAEVHFIEEGTNLLAWIHGKRYVNKTPEGWQDRFRR